MGWTPLPRKRGTPAYLVMHVSCCIAFILLLTHAAFGADNVPKGYKLLHEQSFDTPQSIQQFQFTDANAWKFTKEETGGSLELATQSKYNPPFRSPLNIALIKEKSFGDFVLEADLLQTSQEYG